MKINIKAFFTILYLIVMSFCLSACDEKGLSEITNDVVIKDTEDTIDNSIKYTVRFFLNNVNASEKPKNQMVEIGKSPIEPTHPVLQGYTFKGWFLEEACITPFMFTEGITRDTILYAKWEALDTGDEIPDGLTYAASVARISAYMTQMLDLMDAGTSAYEDKGNDWLGMGPLYINLGFVFPMITVSLTSTFGTDAATEETLESVFSIFGYQNISYEDQVSKYILRYDYNDPNDKKTYHYGIVVEYDNITDSARIVSYKSYLTNQQEIESVFEFVKTRDGYAVQNLNGQAAFKIENKQVTTFTASLYEDEEERTSIYKNMSQINEDFALIDMEYKMIFDGNRYQYIEKEVQNYPEKKYRIVTYEFLKDGTFVDKTEGDWISID